MGRAEVVELGIGAVDPNPEFIENDNVDWANPEEMTIPDDLPDPYFWRVLVMPVQPKKQSKGGILLVESARDAEGHLQIVGKIASLGPLAFRSWKFARGVGDYIRILTGRRVSWAPKVGDWVVYGRYTGQRMEFKRTRLVLMNDDEVLGRADDPGAFRIYV